MSNQVSILCSEKKEEEKNSCRVDACPLRKIWEPSALNLWNSSSKEYTRAHQVLLGHSTAKFIIIFLIFNYFFRFMQMYRETKWWHHKN